MFVYWAHSSIKTVDNIFKLGDFSQKARLLTSLGNSNGLAILSPPLHVGTLPQEATPGPQGDLALWRGHVYPLSSASFILCDLPDSCRVWACNVRMTYILTILIQYLYSGWNISKNKTTWELHSDMGWIPLPTPPIQNLCWSSDLQCVYFGDRVFTEVIKNKCGHKGGALFQYNWCPCKKRNRQ